MTIRLALPTFRGPNYYVPEAAYAADVGLDGICRADLGAPLAADTNGILAAQSIAAAGSTGVLSADYTAAMGSPAVGLARYGRNITVVASGAATSAVTVEGQDYLGQPMLETFTLAGAVPVAGKKAFWSVSKVTWGLTAGTTIDVGWGTLLGIPYRAVNTAMLNELMSGAPPTAGALVAGIATSTVQTATTGDPRGTYAPNSAPDGTRSYVFDYYVDVVAGFYGNRHFAG
jgi:hypothetical protein